MLVAVAGERESQAKLLEAQRRVLEMIVRGSALPDVLAELCRIVEAEADGSVRASILLLDGKGERLFEGAAPSLPLAYRQAIEGIAIGVDVGTCCAAAARVEPVITVDFATDAGWDGLRELPLGIGLRAAWSMPILSSTGSVLGTFGTYFREARGPFEHERRLVEVLAPTAALAIERGRADEQLRLNAERRTFLAELASATQQLVEPADIMATTARMLTEHLDVDRCAYAEVENEAVFVITGDYSRNVPSIVGRWAVDAFGPACVRCMLSGEPFVVHDVDHTPGVEALHKPAYAATGISSVICVPLHKNGKFTAAMAVHKSRPRRWHPAEVELVTAVVARCWEALERARITRTLQESERQAERALSESRARLDYAVRLSGVGFWYCDLPFDELIWDTRVKEHFFLPSDQRVTIDTFYERIHPDDRESTRCAIESSISEHVSYDVVYRTTDPRGGAIKWVRALGGTAYAADGTPARFDGVTVDITPQKLDQERLSRALDREREQARLLEKLAHAALRIHASASLENVLRVVTEEARTIIGTHQSSTCISQGGDWEKSICSVSLSHKYASYQDSEARQVQTRLYAQICNLNKPIRLTQEQLQTDGAWQALLDSSTGQPPLRGWLAAPFVSRDGTHLVVQLSDKHDGEFSEIDEAVLTQLARIAAVALENAHLYDQLRQQDRRKNEFLATLAHELRNPLAPIRTGLQILRTTVDEEQKLRTHDMMERQLGHMVRMVDDLLDISRITLGKTGLKKQRMDLRTAVHSALETTRTLIDQAQHQLIVSLPERPLPLDADSTRLSQVLANLLNNAAKYTPDGGRIELRAEATDTQVTIQVSDTGMGIPADMVSNVFEMFTQVGSTIDRSQGGLGIGLTLVRSLVEMHGGTISAHSAGPGCGATFTIQLPLAEREALSTAAQPHQVTTPQGAPLRVLVVDDNLDGAECLSMLIELMGHQTSMAHSGPDALAATAAFQPHIIFLDIGLPGLNGYEVAARIRQDPSLLQPYLVALTGWGADEDKRQAMAAGFDQHFVKPLDTSKLTDILAQSSRAG